MRIRVSHDLDDLASDLRAIPALVQRDGNRAVRSALAVGNAAARRAAQAASGPHGVNYFKRITAEMTGPLSGEFGPHGGGLPVGGGWRTGGGNNDLRKAAPIAGARLAKEIGDAMDGWFWV